MDGFEEAQGGETLVVERLWAGEFQPPLTDLLLDARRLAVADGLEGGGHRPARTRYPPSCFADSINRILAGLSIDHRPLRHLALPRSSTRTPKHCRHSAKYFRQQFSLCSFSLNAQPASLGALHVQTGKGLC